MCVCGCALGSALSVLIVGGAKMAMAPGISVTTSVAVVVVDLANGNGNGCSVSWVARWSCHSAIHPIRMR